MVPPEKDEHLIDFGFRVRRERLRRNWSQERLADESGLHRTYVGSLERGERNVSLKNVWTLAEALGVDPADLVSG
jgi:transcriptional regulator with XRE-family HTH domain